MKNLYLVLLIASLTVLSSVVTYSAEAAGIPKKAISADGQWATTDLPKGTMNNGFLKASTGATPTYSSIVVSDITDISSTYQAVTGKNVAGGYAGLDSGGKVPNSRLPDAVVRTNQSNTFGANPQTFPNLVLSGDINIGSNALTNSGHRILLPTSNSGTVCLTNQTGSCGATSSGTVTGSQNIGKGTGSFGVLSTPSSTTIKGKNLTAGTGMSISGNTTDITLTSLITQGFTSLLNIGKGTGSLGLLHISGNTIQSKNLTAGTGMSISGNTTDITVTNNGVTSISGTPNYITASSSTGAVTLNLGSNAVTTDGAAQTISKSVTFSNTATINGLRVSQNTKVSTDSPYTVQSTDGVIYADATSGSITINLPTPSTVTGQIFVIKRIDSSIVNTVTVVTPSGYIDSSGTATKTLDHRNQYVGMQSDGTNYRKIMERSYSAFGYMPKGSSLNRFVSSPSTGLALSTAAITLNTIYAMPLVVEETSTVDTVQIKTTTRVAGSFARVGIYSDSGNTQPASLIADFGTLSTGTAGAVSSTTASPLPITLPPGLYWLAIDGGSSVSVQGFAVGGMISLLGDDSGMGTAQGFGWSVASACGGTTCPTALPSTFPAGSTVITAATLPQIAIRLSS